MSIEKIFENIMNDGLSQAKIIVDFINLCPNKSCIVFGKETLLEENREREEKNISLLPRITNLNVTNVT